MKNQEDKIEFRIKIATLNIDFFRGFISLDEELELNEQLNVFIGVNGSGKTSILDAIAEHLQQLVNGVILNQYSPQLYLLKDKDVNNGARETHLKIGFKLSHTIKLDPEEEFREEDNNEEYTFSEPYLVERSLIFTKNRVTNNEYQKEAEFFESFVENLESFKDKKPNMPVMVYYGCNSIDVELDDHSDRINRYERLEQLYKNALNPKRFDFNDFFEWFDTQQGIVNQLETSLAKVWENTFKLISSQIEEPTEEQDQLLKEYEAYQAENKDKLTPEKVLIQFLEKERQALISKKTEEVKHKRELDLVVNTLIEFFKDENGNKYFDKLYVDYSIQERAQMKLYKVEQNMFLNVQQLSSGEKSLFALVADLTRRLILANPNLENPLEGQGIVLIDEIELHLHPRWQGNIIPKLQKTFPNTQFIITTHSPEVLKRIDNNHLFILENGLIKPIQIRTKKKDSVAILSSLFGVKRFFKEVEEKIQHFYALVESEEEEKRKEAEELLEYFVNIWGIDDEFYQRLDNYLTLY